MDRPRRRNRSRSNHVDRCCEKTVAKKWLLTDETCGAKILCVAPSNVHCCRVVSDLGGGCVNCEGVGNCD